MCVRYTYCCIECHQCFAVPHHDSLRQQCNRLVGSLCCFWRNSKEVQCDLLCSNSKCLRRSEKGVRENVGGPPFGFPCCSECNVEDCRVVPISVLCLSCWEKRSVDRPARQPRRQRPDVRAVRFGPSCDEPPVSCFKRDG